MLGQGRLEAYCFDGETRLCHIRGKMRKKVWVTAGDIILIGLRDFQDDKADVIHKYNADEARNLKSCGELPETGNWILRFARSSVCCCHLLSTVLWMWVLLFSLQARTPLINYAPISRPSKSPYQRDSRRHGHGR